MSDSIATSAIRGQIRRARDIADAALSVAEDNAGDSEQHEAYRGHLASAVVHLSNALNDLDSAMEVCTRADAARPPIDEEPVFA